MYGTVYISLSKLRVELKKDIDKLQLEVDVHSFQIDNMMPHVAFPIVIHPQIEEGQGMLKLMLVRMENTAGLQHFKTLQVQLQAISINVELALIASLIEFGTAVIPKKDIIEAQDEARIAEQEDGALIFTPTTMGLGMLYFEEMVLGPMKFFISTSIQTEGLNTMGVGVESGAAVLNVAKAAGVLLTNFKRVPVNMSGLNLSHPFEPAAALTGRVVGHYVTEGAYNAYKFLLGIEVLGNPIGLLDGVGTGVADLVMTPFTVQSPEEFASGMGKNLGKLVQATVGGIFSTVGQTTGAISNVADTLGGGDRAAMRASENRHEPQGVLDGLGSGAVGVGRGLFDGVTGVFVKPVEGAMEGGALGLVQGVGKGVLGLVANPLAGMAGGVSDIMSGIAEDVGSIGTVAVKRFRNPRWISTTGAVIQYDATRALGQQRLVDVAASSPDATKKLLIPDSLVCYIECGNSEELIVTDAHLVHSSHTGGPVTVLKLEDIDHVESGGQVLAIVGLHNNLSVSCGHFDAQELTAELQEALRFTG